MTPPAFKLLAPKNNAVTARLLGAIGAGDTTIALQSGGSATLPTISRGTATSTGDSRTLNDTGDLAGLAEGDYLYNLTDGSFGIVIETGTNSVRTTPLEGGSDNTWTSGDVWVKGFAVCTITQFDSDGSIVKQERVLLTDNDSDSLEVVRGFDGDTAQSFNDGDYVQVLLEEAQIEQVHAAIKNAFIKLDKLHRGIPFTATTTGTEPDYELTLPIEITTLDDLIGLPIVAIIHDANTGAATIAVNGLAATAIKKEGGLTALDAADLADDHPAVLVYNGTSFVLATPTAQAVAQNSPLVFEAKTSNYTIDQDDQLKNFSNYGAAGQVDFTLPTGAAGLTYRFFVEQDTKVLKVICLEGEYILDGTSQYEAYDADAVSEWIELVCIRTGVWRIIHKTGTWTGSLVYITDGWIAGGSVSGSNSNTITRIRTTITGVTAATNGTTLAYTTNNTGSVNSSTNGYTMGRAGGGYFSDTGKFVFSSTTHSSLAATLDTARGYHHQAGIQSTAKGYISGGYSDYNVIDDMNFSTDASVGVGATLSTGGFSVVGLGAPSLAAGYLAGGRISSDTDSRTAVDKLTYASVTRSTISATLTATLCLGAHGHHESATMAWVFGGTNGGGSPTGQSAIERLTFSGETIATSSTSLAAANQKPTGVHHDDRTIICGGYTGSESNAMQTFIHATEAISTSGNTLPAIRSHACDLAMP